LSLDLGPLGQPRTTHLKLFNLVTSMKTYVPNKVTLPGFRIRLDTSVWGDHSIHNSPQSWAHCLDAGRWWTKLAGQVSGSEVTVGLHRRTMASCEDSVQGVPEVSVVEGGNRPLRGDSMWCGRL
jgi:hypothetical protein